MLILIRTQLEEFGRRIAELASPGMLIALIGELGTGKTTLAKAIAAGIGVKEDVGSPTFMIVNEYLSGRLPLYHYDVYRLSSPAELADIAYEDHFYGDGITVVEWADQIENMLPEDAIRIWLYYGDDEYTRGIKSDQEWLMEMAKATL